MNYFILHIIRNILLVCFALAAPISLPAGGIQKDSKSIFFLENPKIIILENNLKLFAEPSNSSEYIQTLKQGTSFHVLRKWINHDNQTWFQVYSNTPSFLDKPLSIRRGWVRF
tara:strand:+ start:9619 stop:9957 length:339 start_codon:yes stop_codon:yes gene_type:complete